MKRKILRILLLVCGMNLFTSCYGMPPETWERRLAPDELPEQSSETKGIAQQEEEDNQSNDAEYVSSIVR